MRERSPDATVSKKDLARLVEFAERRMREVAPAGREEVSEKDAARVLLKDLGFSASAVEGAFADLELAEDRRRESGARRKRLAMEAVAIAVSIGAGAALLYGGYRIGLAALPVFAAALAGPNGALVLVKLAAGVVVAIGGLGIVRMFGR